MEGTVWVAPRECYTCGHVGCCDSSSGKHATKHFHQTQHPVMRAVPPAVGHGAMFMKNRGCSVKPSRRRTAGQAAATERLKPRHAARS